MTNKSLLIADDEFGVRQALYFLFSDLGYNVFTAENGKDAICNLKKKKL